MGRLSAPLNVSRRACKARTRLRTCRRVNVTVSSSVSLTISYLLYFRFIQFPAPVTSVANVASHLRLSTGQTWHGVGNDKPLFSWLPTTVEIVMARVIALTIPAASTDCLVHTPASRLAV